MDYSRFWLSILNADTAGIRTYADKLGVGGLYGLFACMVAGRSWDSITKGIDKTEKNKAEVKQTKAYILSKMVYLDVFHEQEVLETKQRLATLI